MEEIIHQDASTKKRVLALLIDYFLLVIGNVIFYFLIVSQIANTLPIMKDLSNAFYNSYNEVEEIIEESKLDSISSLNYLKMSVKTRLGESYFVDTEYELLGSLNKENDPIYFYLNNYKSENISSYLNNDINLESYLNKIEKSSFFDMSQDNYYLLKEDIAIKVGDYLFNDNQVFKNEYESLYSFIVNNFNDCSLDLRENNSLYLNSYSLLNSSSNSIRGANFIELNISFVFSFLFIYLLTFLLNKKHKSLGLIAMKLTYDFSKKPSKTKLFLKVLLAFILTYSSIFLSLFLTSGASYGQVIMFDLNGFYLALLLLVFSLLISLFSFILEFLPIAKSSLSDYFLSFKIKDETLVEENESSR